MCRVRRGCSESNGPTCTNAFAPWASVRPGNPILFVPLVLPSPRYNRPEMRWISVILALVALAAAGCSHKGYAADDKTKVHVGIVFDIGGKEDHSFNSAGWEGVGRAARDLPIVLRDVEQGDPTSIEPAMRAFAERGYDLIIGVGYSQTAIIESVAKDYPSLNFAVIDGVSQLPNVASLVFREHEGSYLV